MDVDDKKSVMFGGLLFMKFVEKKVNFQTRHSEASTKKHGLKAPIRKA